MMRIRNISIKRKLLLLQLFIVFVVLVLASFFYLLNDSRIYRETISTKLSSMANILGYNCTSALEFHDNRDAALTLSSLKAETLVTHAWVMDASGRLFADYTREGQGFTSPIGGESDFEVVRGRALYLSRPIVKGLEIMGTVILRYDLSPHRKILMRNALLAGLALLVGMAIALALTVFSQRVMTDPILRLVDTIEHVSRTKDLSIRIVDPREDEIGVLYRGFNDMLAEIHRREEERGEAAAALRESEEKYRTFVENAKDGIVIIQDERFVYANPSLVAMSESSREELIGTAFFQHVAEEEVPKLTDYYERRMIGVESSSMYETIFKTKTGKRIHAEVNAAQIPYRGKPADLVIIRNINERKKAEQEILKLNESLEQRVLERTKELENANERLVELDRLKSLFLASMSHELRTPLNSILGFTGLLLMGLSGPMTEEQTKQLTMVQNSSRHLLELINEILDISKIESGRVDLAIESFSMAELTDETIKAVAPLAAAKELKLAAASPKDLMLHSDRRRVKQVLVNLLGNAIKFSDHGSIRVEVVEVGDSVSVCVSDQGIGIRKEDLQRLFNAFSQIDMSSTKRYEGTGLGLYLSRKILTLLGGTITVESEYGQGSRFTFSLPLEWKDGSHENGAHY